MNRVAILLLAGVGLLAVTAAQARAIESVSAPEPQPSGATWDPDLSGAAYSLPDFDLWTEHVSEELEAMPHAPYTVSTVNRAAALTVIAVCEGTENAGGYACLYGSTPASRRTFSGFADHPRIVSRISATDSRWTSAAGRYQFMAVSPIPGGGRTSVNTWDRIKRKLNLPDFSPASQDAAALELMAECGALADIDAGRILEGLDKCRRVWASLPGANYAGQGMRSPAFLVAAFKAAGGALA